MITWQEIKKGKTISDQTYNNRNLQLNVIRRFFDTKGIDLEDPDLYKRPELYAFICSFLDQEDKDGKMVYAKNTQIGYLDVFGALVDYNNGLTIIKKKLQDLTILLRSTYVSSVQPLVITDSIVAEFETKIKAISNRPVQLIAMFSMNDDLTGLRLDDLIHIYFNDDKIHHYLNRDTGVLLFRKGATKARTDRVITLSKHTLELINEHCRGDYLLSNGKLEPYANTRYLSTEFKKVFGYNLGEIRKGSAQQNSTGLISESIANANRLGHSVATELFCYVSETNKIKPVIKRRLEFYNKSSHEVLMRALKSMIKLYEPLKWV